MSVTKTIKKQCVAVTSSIGLVVLVSMASAMSGCQTTRLISAAYELKDCSLAVKGTPAYQVISKNWKTMIGTDDPTAEELLNPGKPSPDEVAALVAVHNGIAKCRGNGISQYSKAYPELIPVMVESYKQADQIDLDLIAGKITWGDANRLYMNGKKDMLVKMQYVFAHKEELDRQAKDQMWESAGTVVKGVLAVALIALQAWSEGQKARGQAYQSYLMTHRLVTTNCHISMDGHSIGCMSQ